MFYARAVEILETFAQSVAELRSEPGKLTGTVVLGTIPSISAAFIPQVAKRIRTEEPNLELNIVERTSTDLNNLFNAGTLDLAIRSYARLFEFAGLSTEKHEMAMRTLWIEPYVVAFPEDSPHMPNTEVVTPEQLEGLPLAVTGATYGKQDWDNIKEHVSRVTR